MKQWYEEIVTVISVLVVILANELDRGLAEVIAFGIVIFALASIRKSQ